MHPLALLFLLTVQAQPGKPRLAEISESFEALAERINPSVVSIFSTGYSVGQGITSARELIAESRSRGSGVILSEDGYVVTNAHVVAGARRIRLLLPRRGEGSSILGTRGDTAGAQIVGVDLETDLAVLKIEGTGLPYLELGDSEALRPGEIVFAFGSPLGLDNSVTMGVVSASARQLRPDDPMIYIQTDASINPGNSGGPLVDAVGNVVGINTLIFSKSGGSEGLSFAAPSNIVKNVFEQIRKNGRVHRGEIGVTAQSISPLMARGLDLPQDWGAILADVAPCGPAEKAGLQVGDIVVSLDGKIMENARQLAVNLYQRSIADRVRLEVLRGTERLSVRRRSRSPEGPPQPLRGNGPPRSKPGAPARNPRYRSRSRHGAFFLGPEARLGRDRGRARGRSDPSRRGRSESGRRDLRGKPAQCREPRRVEGGDRPLPPGRPRRAPGPARRQADDW